MHTTRNVLRFEKIWILEPIEEMVQWESRLVISIKFLFPTDGAKLGSLDLYYSEKASSKNEAIKAVLENFFNGLPEKIDYNHLSSSDQYRNKLNLSDIHYVEYGSVEDYRSMLETLPIVSGWKIPLNVKNF